VHVGRKINGGVFNLAEELQAEFELLMLERGATHALKKRTLGGEEK